MSSSYFGQSAGSVGVTVQLNAEGLLNSIMTSVPGMSFWRFRFLPYSNFAMQNVIQPFVGARFGSNTTLDLQKIGDLWFYTYAVVQLPGIIPCSAAASGCGSQASLWPYAVDPSNACAQQDAAYFNAYSGGAAGWYMNNYASCGDYAEDCLGGCGGGDGDCNTQPWVHWVNAIGQFVLEAVTLYFGTQLIDTLYNDFMYQWEEIAGKPGKRLTEMIGKYKCREDLIAAAGNAQMLYVPLPFYFTGTPGNALPICAMLFAGARIAVRVADLSKCGVCSGPGVAVFKCSGGALGANDIQLYLDSTQISLDIVERDRFASSNFEQLGTQTYTTYRDYDQNFVQFPITTGGTVIEYMWAFRRKCQQAKNQHFNYSGINGKDPMQAASLSIGSVIRQPESPAIFYREVQPYQFHTLIPQTFVYVYSFSLYPEEAQPSGAFVAGRCDNITMNFAMQEGLGANGGFQLIFTSRVLQMIKFRNGGASLTTV